MDVPKKSLFEGSICCSKISVNIAFMISSLKCELPQPHIVAESTTAYDIAKVEHTSAARFTKTESTTLFVFILIKLLLYLFIALQQTNLT